MNSVSLLWSIFQKSHANRLMSGFLIYFLFSAVIFWLFDPGVDTFFNGLWLAFNIASSIGLGDYTVTTLIARIVAIILGIYGVIIVAFIPGLIASYYAQTIENQKKHVLNVHKEKLAHVDEMSKEELQALSKKIKEGKA